MNNIIESVFNFASPKIAELGYELVDVDFKKVYGQDNLTLYIFKYGGVSLDDCEAVNALFENSDELDNMILSETYILNVSSLGLDRPIVTEDDYRRSLDTEIEVIFAVPQGKKKKVFGFLVSYDEGTITLKNKDKDIIIPRDSNNITRPYINFK